MATPGRKSQKAQHDWLLPFMKFRQDLVAATENDAGTVHHSLLLTNIADKHHIAAFLDQLEPWYHYQSEPFEVIPVQVAKGVWAHHCFFGDRSRLEALESRLRGVRTWLKRVSQLPDFRPPIEGNHLEQNSLLTWMSALYHLAIQFDDPGLDYELLPVVAEDDERLFFQAWDLCDESVEWGDPVPLITLTSLKRKGESLWHPGGPGDNSPSLIQVTLNVDLIAASLNAVTLMKYFWTDPGSGTVDVRRVAINKVMEDRRRKRNRKRLKEGGLSDMDTAMLDLIVEHHEPIGGSPRRTPLTSRELIELAGGLDKDQPGLSRRMNRIFRREETSAEKQKKRRSNGMMIYRELCRTGRLRQHVEWLENKQLWGGPRTAHLGDRAAEVTRNNRSL